MFLGCGPVEPSPGQEDAALRLGADAYLTKPYTAESLLKTVQQVLSGGGAPPPAE